MPDVRCMFNATAPAHAPTAINDTMMLRFHIAILKIRKTISHCEAESKG